MTINHRYYCVKYDLHPHSHSLPYSRVVYRITSTKPYISWLLLLRAWDHFDCCDSIFALLNICFILPVPSFDFTGIAVSWQFGDPRTPDLRRLRGKHCFAHKQGTFVSKNSRIRQGKSELNSNTKSNMNHELSPRNAERCCLTPPYLQNLTKMIAYRCSFAATLLSI